MREAFRSKRFACLLAVVSILFPASAAVADPPGPVPPVTIDCENTMDGGHVYRICIFGECRMWTFSLPGPCPGTGQKP